MSDSQHPATPTATAKPKKYKEALPVVGLLLAAMALLYGLTGGFGGLSGARPSSMTDEAIETRIQKVGHVTLAEAKGEPKQGQEVFNGQCAVCHTAGLVGAPKLGDAAVWAPRIKTGFDSLLASALKGKGSMGAQSGAAFSDFEIARAVVYMANAGGAKLDEPTAPAADAPAK